ncbi:MAG: O-antigen ligase family protein [Candidatus Eremiobacteraeota bacterium]|nr:O-antigen ligase family protein [Candidatus Eremiobacteraeota bacterium]
MTGSLLLLPPVIDQTIQRVPLDPWSAIIFVLVIFASIYLGFRRSPWIAALLAFAVPFAAYRDIAHTTITIEKCAVFGAAFGLLLGGAPLWPRSQGAQRVLLAGGALLLAITLSSTNAAYAWPVVREFFKQAEYLVLFWCAATFIERIDRSQAYFIGGVAAAAAIVSTLAVSQAVIGGAPSGVWVNGHPLPRVAGTLEGPNQLAGFLESTLPILWVWPMLSFGWKPLRDYVTGASSAALILTQSRAGVLIAALSYAILWRLQRTTARTSLISMSIGATFGVIVSAGWFLLWAHASFADIQRLFLFAVPGEPGGVGTRIQLWPAAIELFRHHPIVGVGAGNFELLLSTVGLHGIQTHASSLWLQTLAEQGLIGFAALLVFSYVALRETFACRTSALGLAAFLAIVSLLAHQLVDDLFFFPKVGALCWLLLGAGTALPSALSEPSSNGKPRALAMADEKAPAPAHVGASSAIRLPD